MLITTWQNNSVDSKILLSLFAYLFSGHILDGCSWRRVLQSYDNNETVAQADASCPVEKSSQKTFQKSPHNSIKTKTCRQEYAPFFAKFASPIHIYKIRNCQFVRWIYQLAISRFCYIKIYALISSVGKKLPRWFFHMALFLEAIPSLFTKYHSILPGVRSKINGCLEV